MIVVTTPTGAVGSQVVQLLLDHDAPVRVVARDPARLPEHVRRRVEVVPGSHGGAEVVTRAFAGADAVFWLVPPDYRTHSLDATYVDFTRPACEAFIDQGVERVVAVSVLGRGSPLADNAGLVTASLAMRDLIASTGVSLRALALPLFMSNLMSQVEPIRSQGTFFGVLSPDLKLPAVAPRDIAAAAVEVLLDDTWSGQDDVPVLGPEDLSNNDMAKTVSDVLERPIRYQQVPAEGFVAGLLADGVSEAMAHGLLDMLRAKGNGVDHVEPRTARATTPTTFRQWCEDTLKPAVRA